MLDFSTALMDGRLAPVPVASISRFRLLDTYLGFNLATGSSRLASFRWGPSEGGAMIP
jgi:hypothetical protein